jgi:uncharacterized protein YecE (DUF72 family)
MEKGRESILIGTSGWTYEHWKGRFYPAGLPQKRWFEYYLTFFPTVEINATFYRLFKDQTYLNWGERTPADFRFVLKVPRLITHVKLLQDVEEDVHQFWNSASLLGAKLGLVLLQIAPDMPYDVLRLRRAIQAFGNPRQVAVEFRREDWYKEEIRELLQEVGAVFCDAESPRFQLTGWVTSSTGYIRLHGKRQWYSYNYSGEDLQEIASKAHQMKANGAKQVYIFFNNDYEAYAPANALSLMKILDGKFNYKLAGADSQP